MSKSLYLQLSTTSDGNGEAILYSNRLLETPANTHQDPVPINSLVNYKSLTRNIKHQKSSGTRETLDTDSLARQVLKECQNNHFIINFLQTGARDPRKTQGSSKAKSKKETRVPTSESSSPGSTPPRRSKRSRKATKKRRRSKNNSKNNSSSSESWETSSDSSVDRSPASKRDTGYTPFFNPVYK